MSYTVGPGIRRSRKSPMGRPAEPIPPASDAPITPQGVKRVRTGLRFIERFRPVPAPVAVVADLLPISDDAVLDWYAQDREARKHLSWSMAKALAYIDSFRPKR